MKVFFNDIETDKEIHSSEPIELNLEEAINELFELSESDGSFIGFYAIDNSIIQFMWESDSILIDIPVPEQQGSLQKNVEFNECIEMIKQIYSGTKPSDIEGLTFSDW